MTGMIKRRTIVAHGRMAMRELRLDAARHRRHGLQIMTFEQLAVRLAGGFARPIDDESLRKAIQAVLSETPLGELESIKLLPGMVDASADILHKAWRAGIDLASRAHEHLRLDSIARLESAVLAQLPPGVMRPCDLVAAACQRLDYANAVLGPVEIVGITELSPCWRPLLSALTGYIPVTWSAGPRPTPSWLEAIDVTIAREGLQTAQDSAALTDRARALIAALGRVAIEDPSQGLSPIELARCVTRTLALPEIAGLRPVLTPELPVYASTLLDEVEQATAGVADAAARGSDGAPQVIIDWKSDVQPTPETVNHYRAQVRAYLDMTGAARGLIVLVTTGEIIAVTPSPLASVAA